MYGATVDERKALVAPIAAKYSLDLATVAAVCEQESSWNPWAVRFEPGFEARYIKPANPAMPTTLELTKAMSFGLMQVMGEVAIEHGFAGRFMTELCAPAVGVEYGCRKLRRCFDLHTDPTAALLAYNGGSNLEYASQVLARVPTYGG